MADIYQWCIAGVPGVRWAKKLFPDDTEKIAVRKLWEAILDTSRVTGTPTAAWREHNKELALRSEHLNDLHLVKLHYKSKNGTDLTVGLNPDVLFAAGGEKTTAGRYFNPNIPTEEVFTSPKRGEADGVVYSTKPLCYNGSLIENFRITFKDGHAVDCHAEKNEELLKELIGMDEGASYLGEVALVPYSSPIQKTGLLFYNSLYDENAVCHLALGLGFTNLHKDYAKIGEDGAHKAGINDSIIHEDFMIGSPDLSIVGTTADGKEVTIFKDGEFAF
ncbi:MAG: aminopeptidase [Clostridia bacterium]|nr:aminopeptidase [Clostridia bacterium]